ncbi:acetyl-CoA carboxylase [Culex quinquefasciatus]|uniref:Acetyl-CoA carboxylase n=1 Tax=Culex quinquefasciatus TaxID=7176 RepID=B0XAC4_CULQU|nr:acetyl-CoA carboxylase [Culex quinquefasciatus]|eukprot:XP_001866596.1 acetyl-CoA carboxylase [Culex quinquefasciatus]
MQCWITSIGRTRLQHLELSGKVPLINFQFLLPTAHPQHSTLQTPPKRHQVGNLTDSFMALAVQPIAHRSYIVIDGGYSTHLSKQVSQDHAADTTRPTRTRSPKLIWTSSKLVPITS